jgi:glycosyltransferase involved in cell wall biosynthesis
VLCFGFVAPYKGLEAALEASRRSGAFRLVVAGGEHPRLARRNPKRGYLAQLISQFGDVARFTGYVSERDVARWFSAADIALFPYPDPFSSSGALALALGFGTPVVVSPAVGDCIDAPKDLRVPLDPDGLARALNNILNDPVRLDAIRQSSETLRAGRTWAESARAHLDLYEEVLHADSLARRRVRAV